LFEFEKRNSGSTVPGNSKASAAPFTDEMGALDQMQRDSPGRVWARAEVATAFRTLRLKDCHISKLDAGLAAFASVTSLDCSGNPLVAAECLPPALVGLTLNGCTLAPGLLRKLEGLQLRSLSMAFCHLLMPPQLVPSNVPRLCALDLSGNDFCDLDSLCADLSGLDSLAFLNLEGNPVTLLPCYRSRVSNLLPLASLDDVSISEADTSLPDSTANTITLQATLESVAGVSAAVLEHGWIEVLLVGVVASAPLADPQPEPEPDEAPAKGKKAGKKGAEEPAAPLRPVVPKRVLNLSLVVSVALRDAVLFTGLQVRICAPTNAANSYEGSAVVCWATVSLRPFAESSSLGAIHELVPMELAPEFAQPNDESEDAEQVPPVLKISIALNPSVDTEKNL
jgi:hypothetical protein